MIWQKRPAVMLLCLTLSIAPANASDGGLAGRWRSPDMGGGIVEIAQCGPAYCGRIVGGAFEKQNPDQRDTRNRNQALRTRPIKGLVIMTGFVGGPKTWTGGSLYRPLDGGTYSGTITLEGERLRLKGCIVWPLCRTQTWDRIH